MKRMLVEYIAVANLSPLEGHGVKRVSWLKDKIVSEGVWTVPLMVEETKFIVMDGHHRFEVAKAMGLQRVPAVLCSYNDVKVWSLRPDSHSVTPQIIFHNHATRTIFPYKTAKHDFSEMHFEFEGVNLDELKN